MLCACVSHCMLYMYAIVQVDVCVCVVGYMQPLVTESLAMVLAVPEENGDITDAVMASLCRDPAVEELFFKEVSHISASNSFFA